MIERDPDAPDTQIQDFNRWITKIEKILADEKLEIKGLNDDYLDKMAERGQILKRWKDNVGQLTEIEFNILSLCYQNAVYEIEKFDFEQQEKRKDMALKF